MGQLQASIRAIQNRTGKSYQVDTGTRNGVRRRVRFSSLADAREFVAQIKKERQAHGTQWLILDPAERAEVLTVLSEMRNAGVALKDVWAAHKTRTRRESPTNVIAMRQFIASKKERGLRPAYIVELELFISRFIEGREYEPVDTLTKKDVEEHLAPYENPHTFKGRWGQMSSFFSFCLKREWIDRNPVLLIDKPVIDRQAPKILSVSEVHRLLTVAKDSDPEFLPYLLLGIYCGIRPEEILRLSVDDFQWRAGPGESKVIVRSEVSKTRRRRIVDIPVALELWKSEVVEWDSAGRLVNRRKRFVEIRNAAKIEWSQDVMRHTAASIMVANYESAEKAALQLGHSTQTLMTHYREIMTKEVAADYLSLRPQ